MNFFSFIVLCTLLLACGGKESAVSRQLASADSVVVNFNAASGTIIEKTISATDAVAIKKLKRFVNSKTSAAYKCGYNGNLQFFSKGILAGDFSFNYEKGCLHFIQQKDGQLFPTVMSEEAADFLQSLAAGKSWY